VIQNLRRKDVCRRCGRPLALFHRGRTYAFTPAPDLPKVCGECFRAGPSLSHEEQTAIDSLMAVDAKHLTAGSLNDSRRQPRGVLSGEGAGRRRRARPRDLPPTRSGSWRFDPLSGGSPEMPFKLTVNTEELDSATDCVEKLLSDSAERAKFWATWETELTVAGAQKRLAAEARSQSPYIAQIGLGVLRPAPAAAPHPARERSTSRASLGRATVRV
jgi:hypothetical protein